MWAMSCPLCWLVFAASMCCWFVASGYNLDALVPTVVNSGLPSSARGLFGFSVAQHQFSDGRKIVLVGAPHDTVGGLAQGSVWECPLEHQATCDQQIAFNSRDSSPREGFQLANSMINTEDYAFNGQKLGFSVRSFGERILACAPLYIGDVRLDSTNAVNFSTTYGRCTDMPRDYNSSTTPYQLFSRESFSLAGIGLGRATLVAGASLPHVIIGSIFARSGQYRGGRVTTAQLDYANTLRVYDKRFETDISGLNTDRYLGYHIETGMFTNNMIDEVIASSPRASNHQGTITILKSPTTNTDSEFVNPSIQILTGDEGADTYFGIDFAVIDFKNANGRHSVVVGCPLCNREKGAIIVYLNTGDNSAPLNLTQRFRFPGQQKAWFGVSVENIGDIDRDGFDDIAVGAPFMGNGAVYVFRGTQEGLLLEDYQVIRSSGISGFGYSVTGGLDLDDNGYADITIGTSSGQQVTSIRAAPMVTVTPSFSKENFTINSADKNCTVDGVPLACFQIVPCFQYTTVFGVVPQFAVQFTLTVDSALRRVGLYRGSDSDIGPFSVTSNVTIANGAARTCVDPYNFVLRPDFTTTDPFPINLTISPHRNPVAVPSSNSAVFGGALHPVLTRYSSGRDPVSLTAITMATTEFMVNCGNDSICNPVYTIGAEIANNGGEVFLASDARASYTVTVTNTNEAGFTAYLDVTSTPSIFILDSAEPITVSALATGRCDTSRCMLKNPILPGESVRLRLTFRPNFNNSQLSLRETVLKFTVGANETALVSTNITVNTRSVAGYDFIVGTGSSTVQAMRITPAINTTTTPIAGIGPELTYQITVSNSRNSTVGSPIPRSVINIVWPSVFMDGERPSPLLVPLRINSGADVECKESGAIPKQLLQSNQYNNLPILTPLSPGLMALAQNSCIASNGTSVKCGIIQCEVRPLRPSSANDPVVPFTITINSRLWSPSVRRPYTVDVFATIESSSEYPVITDSTTQRTTRVSFIPAVQEVAGDCFLGWVIIVGIVGGLLLLLLLLLVLTMFGKFGHHQYTVRMQKQELRQKQEYTETDGNGTAVPRAQPSLIMPTARTIPPQGAFAPQLEKEAEAEKENEELEKQERAATKQLAEFLEPAAEYYDDTQVETEI